jgi:hypothetical protein
MVIVPPYCGVPSESHQFPVVAVVVGVVVVETAVEVVVFVVVVVVLVVVVVFVVVVDNVFVVQDASTIESTNKKLKPNQIIFLFILPPILLVTDMFLQTSL